VSAQRVIDDVDAQDHPRSASKRSVVDVSPAEPRVIAKVHTLKARSRGECIAHMPL
jgi:hypothetical protein